MPILQASLIGAVLLVASGAIRARTARDSPEIDVLVVIAASCSLLTPIGYQTNTMVYGRGGYRFSDYVRLGAPLTIASVLTVVFTA